MGLVEAMDLLAEKEMQARLRWAGPMGEDPYAKGVRAFVDAKGLSGRVTFLGSIPGEGVRNELKRVSVFALVSFEEGAPMGIAEAMAAGVPVVTSNRCGMPYMVRHGESGLLVDPHDSRGIGASLRTLLSDSALRKSMGERAARHARDRFHPDRVAERTLGVYRAAISSGCTRT